MSDKINPLSSIQNSKTTVLSAAKASTASTSTNATAFTANIVTAKNAIASASVSNKSYFDAALQNYLLGPNNIKSTTPSPTPASYVPISDAVKDVAPLSSVKKLKASGPIVITHDGQVVEGLDITSKNGAAISVNGFKNVVIKNCKITANNGPGITATMADGIKIQNVDIINGSASVGLKPNTSANQDNIHIANTKGVTITNARLTGGSSGVCVDVGSNVNISNIEGYNFKGPMPRGQLVQLGQVTSGTINGFYCKNDPNNSWPEDNISLYASQNITVQNGLLDGNNSHTGVGVMAEGSSNCLIQNVDAIHQGTASFAASNSQNITFKDVRTKDNIATSGRGANASGSLMFGSEDNSTGTIFQNAIYSNPINPGNIFWDQNGTATADIKQQNFVTKTPLKLVFGWSKK